MKRENKVPNTIDERRKLTDMIVVYDACVLYSASLRDLLIRLARVDSFGFRAKWTRQIQDEFIRNLYKNRPDDPPDRYDRLRKVMNRAVLDCLVTDYASLISSITLPDADDRHVVAAAIKCGANYIVTHNLKDFPSSILNPYSIKAIHPDTFIVHCLNSHLEQVLEVIKEQRADLKSPPLSAHELLEKFKKDGLKESSTILRKHIDLL